MTRLLHCILLLCILPIRGFEPADDVVLLQRTGGGSLKELSPEELLEEDEDQDVEDLNLHPEEGVAPVKQQLAHSSSRESGLGDFAAEEKDLG
eukprot:CAMPEP_0181462386 /NCGR_PEP_ID=MMETSP1110-20121109/34369_1 /TAXON_ID=174948 /ORGANISM="Symbiodinium sp., Strain CCMP421" /LENGTH=92 /DNA_ID=CAMNT_0023587045 /DNA_START=51 /DNA_END=327 /DNA_ORIENTATION=-